MCDNQGDKYLFLQHTVHFKTVSSPIVAAVGLYPYIFKKLLLICRPAGDSVG